MGSTRQLFNLGWNDFDRSLKQSVGGLRSHGDLVDVTLAADGETFPAHKVVLSASSPLLLRLFKLAPTQNPVILLADINATDIEVLLDFIYNGEVQVHSDRLPSLLRAARILDINGLSRGKITSDECPEDSWVAEAAYRAAMLSAQRPYCRSKDIRRAKRAKRKLTGSICTPINDRWVPGDSSGNESTDTEGAPLGRWTSVMSDLHHQAENTTATGDINPFTSMDGVEPAPSSPKETEASPLNSTNDSVRSRSPSPLTIEEYPDDLPEESQSPLRNSQAEKNANAEGNSHAEESLNADDDDFGSQEDDNLAAIAAAADAAAVAATTMIEKKGAAEEPIACPYCNYVIKQSRNLRRHLEIRHFRVRMNRFKARILNTEPTTTANDSGESSVEIAISEPPEVEVEEDTRPVSATIVECIDLEESEVEDISPMTPSPPISDQTLTFNQPIISGQTLTPTFIQAPTFNQLTAGGPTLTITQAFNQAPSPSQNTCQTLAIAHSPFNQTPNPSQNTCQALAIANPNSGPTSIQIQQIGRVDPSIVRHQIVPLFSGYSPPQIMLVSGQPYTIRSNPAPGSATHIIQETDGK